MIILNFQLCLGDISEHPNASEDVASKTYDAEDDVLCDVTGLLNKIIKFTFWLRYILFRMFFSVLTLLKPF